MEQMKQIASLLERGVSNIYPSKEFLANLLKSGKKLKVYLGIDPTGPTLHLGHAINLKKLSEFQKLGHKVILLIGDFTAMIGDPTGKGESRKQLSHKQVLENAKLYKKQASIFLDFKGENKAEIKYNSKWLAKMNFEDVLGLAAKMTVGQMIERDMFQERIKAGKPIYLHEFLYPLMQAQDSVAMDVDGEIGGNDQTFNMLTGRTLTKEVSDKEKFVLTLKLLTDSKGVKMGKTEGNMITLQDSATEMFGKVMSWEDKLILPGLELCTNVPEEEIQIIKQKLDAGVNPKEQKMYLAGKIVEIYYEKLVVKAKNSFIRTFEEKGTPEDVTTIRINKGEYLKKVLLKNKIVSSGSEFARLIKEGAIHVGEQKVTDLFFKIDESAVVKVGKRRFIKVEVS